jgi:hypothetical protein
MQSLKDVALKRSNHIRMIIANDKVKIVVTKYGMRNLKM